MARGTLVLVFSAALILGGCQGQPKTNAADTGGGGIGRYQDHRDTQGKSSTNAGISAAPEASGQPPQSGVQVPGNADSPAESNGGTGGSPKPYPLAVAQGQTNEQNSNTVGH